MNHSQALELVEKLCEQESKRQLAFAKSNGKTDAEIKAFLEGFRLGAEKFVARLCRVDVLR